MENSRLRSLFHWSQPTDRDVFTLTLTLVGGLAFFAPLFATTINTIGLSLPLPLLVGVGITALVFAAFALIRNQLLLGTVVALVVTSTFAANIPLVANSEITGHLGPQIWLFQLAALAVLASLALTGRLRQTSTRTELALAFVVVWSLLSATIGNPVNQTVALYFVLYAFSLYVAFAAISRVIATTELTLWQFVIIFTTTAVGQTIFAVIQLVNQSAFGYTFLGETLRFSKKNAIQTPLGDVLIGVFVSGFTGGSGPLSVLLVIALPLLAALAVETTGWRRWSAASMTVIGIAVLRATAKDAAKFSIIIAAIVGGGVWIFTRYRVGRSLIPADTGSSVISAVAAIGLNGVLFVPSSKTGTTSNRSPSGATETTTSASTTTTAETTVPTTTSSSTAPTSTTTAPTETTTTSTTPPAGSSGGEGGSQELSIPFVDLTSLGIRLQQYVAGIDIAVTHPLFGIGGASYPFVAAEYGLPATLAGHPFPLHNMYISLAAGLGFPGVLAFCVMLALVGWCTLSLTFQYPDQPFYLGVSIAVFGFAAVAFWVVFVRYVFVVPFMLLAGAIVGEYQSSTTFG